MNIHEYFEKQDSAIIADLTKFVDQGMELTPKNVMAKYPIGYNRALIIIEKFLASEF